MSFEKLRVYQAAELLDSEVRALIKRVPRGHGERRDQLDRAIGSILYNIPEANGLLSIGKKRYHLELALGSADETRGVLRRLVNDGALKKREITRASALTSAIAKMLLAMIRALPPE